MKQFVSCVCCFFYEIGANAIKKEENPKIVTNTWREKKTEEDCE